MNLKLLYIIILIYALPNQVWAYYLIQSPEPFTMHGEREEAPPSAQKGIFTVQDNFNAFTRTDGTSPILLPHSDYFVAADSIDINIPIFGMFSHPVQLNQDPLANMLYANLQLKKILEDYAAIQKRAKILLGQVQPYMPSGKIAVNNTTDKSTLIPQKDSPQEHPAIKKKLAQTKKKLASASSSITGALLPITIDNNKNQSAEKKLIFTFQELHKQITMQNKKLSAANMITHSAGTGKTATHNKFSQNLYKTNSSSPKGTASRQKSSYSGTGQISLPWILELPFKIFDFIITHKITALLISLVLLMLFNLIFGSRS